MGLRAQESNVLEEEHMGDPEHRTHMLYIDILHRYAFSKNVV